MLGSVCAHRVSGVPLRCHRHLTATGGILVLRTCRADMTKDNGAYILITPKVRKSGGEIVHQLKDPFG